jgi:C1A family cysteine protease
MREVDGTVDINPYIPDTTGFVLQGDAVQVNDQVCDDYRLTVTTMNKTSVYDLYISRNSGMPVRYQMMGYDSLIGSHFDLYQVDYLNVTEGADIFPDGIFDHPAGACGGFPGPGFFHMNPLDEMSQYYPGAEVDGIVSEEYAAYMESHGKSYETDVELRQREMVYHKNKHFISSHQRRFRVGAETFTVGLNFLADHLPEEMNARRGKLKGVKSSNNASGYHLRNYYDADLPASIDWRIQGAVTAPQDQGICGSCWSFGSTGAIEGAYFLKYGSLKVMAEQELMDCSWDFGNNACDGGEDFRAYDWILQNGGMSFKENYGPYLMQDGYCSASTRKPDVSLQSYVNVTEFDENALMDALASQGPVSISIDASHPGLSFYTSGIYYDPACKSDLNDLDHSVLAVGYGTDPTGGDYWWVKNRSAAETDLHRIWPSRGKMATPYRTPRTCVFCVSALLCVCFRC